MTDANKTEVVVVVDRSGSMQSIREDAEGGLNSFLDKMKAMPGEVRLTLVQFDNRHEILYEDKPIRDVCGYVLKPRSQTALYDAIGFTITQVGYRLARRPEHERPGKIVFMIVTDGEENASHEFLQEQIRSMITEQKNKYGWQFSYLCTSENAMYDGMRLGMDQSSVLRYAHSRMGVNSGYRAAGQCVANYVSGHSHTMGFGTAMVDAQGNIVNDPLKLNITPDPGGNGNGTGT